MGIKVLKWHPQALDEFVAILQYCEEMFGWNTARKVRAQFESRLSILQLFPNMGRDEDLLKNKDGLKYRSLALPPTKIIYTIHSSYIYIHELWNTRRNPDDLSEILKDREL